MAEQYERIFKETDTNGDGELTLEELIGALRKNGYRGTDGEIKKLFRSCDVNKDGKITMDEYMTAMGVAPPEQHKCATYMRVFGDFDLDGSGEIDKGELRNVMAEMNKHFTDKELERMIELFDKDGSGTLNYKEFVKQIFGVDVE